MSALTILTSPSGFTPEGRERALAQALLLGFECRVSEFDMSGYRWNSGSPLGKWEATKDDCIISFLSSKGYFVTIDGELERI